MVTQRHRVQVPALSETDNLAFPLISGLTNSFYDFFLYTYFLKRTSGVFKKAQGRWIGCKLSRCNSELVSSSAYRRSCWAAMVNVKSYSSSCFLSRELKCQYGNMKSSHMRKVQEAQNGFDTCKTRVMTRHMRSPSHMFPLFISYQLLTTLVLTACGKMSDVRPIQRLVAAPHLLAPRAKIKGDNSGIF